MILTVTIDTHPHTNALIEGQVRTAVEAALQQAGLGVVLDATSDDCLEDLKQQAEHTNQSFDHLRNAMNAVQDRLEKAAAHLFEGDDDAHIESAHDLVQEALAIAEES